MQHVPVTYITACMYCECTGYVVVSTWYHCDEYTELSIVSCLRLPFTDYKYKLSKVTTLCKWVHYLYVL